MKSLTRNQLKYLAVIAMLIDHCAFNFYAIIPPGGILWEVMHFIGRLANPIMCYFISEGYIHTRNVRRYVLRLAVFALISWLPFNLFVYGEWPRANLGVMFTLMLGLTAIIVWDKVRANIGVKLVIIALLCYISRYGDWRYINVILPLMFFIYRYDEPKKWLMYYGVVMLNIVRQLQTGGLVHLYQTGLLLFPLIMIFSYSGEGGSRSSVHKWFFYVFYPMHMIILWLLR